MRQTSLEHADFLAYRQIQVPGGYTIYAHALSKLGLPQVLLLREVLLVVVSTCFSSQEIYCRSRGSSFIESSKASPLLVSAIVPALLSTTCQDPFKDCPTVLSSDEVLFPGSRESHMYGHRVI